MRILIIADMHLGHEELAEDKFRPRGFSEKILSNLGRIINPSDLLINLGDICINSDETWHERIGYIDCKRWLILGNHDKKTWSWYMNHGWDWVGDSCSVEMFGKKILFSHIPVKENGQFDINIHGHFHNFGLEKVREKEPEVHAILTPKHHLVCLEDLNFEPVKLERIIKMYQGECKNCPLTSCSSEIC